MCEVTHEAYTCSGRKDKHEGMHHDYDKRLYWIIRADGSIETIAEGPRT
jgi:hypothetical protein